MDVATSTKTTEVGDEKMDDDKYEERVQTSVNKIWVTLDSNTQKINHIYGVGQVIQWIVGLMFVGIWSSIAAIGCRAVDLESEVKVSEEKLIQLEGQHRAYEEWGSSIKVNQIAILNLEDRIKSIQNGQETRDKDREIRDKEQQTKEEYIIKVIQEIQVRLQQMENQPGSKHQTPNF